MRSTFLERHKLFSFLTISFLLTTFILSCKDHDHPDPSQAKTEAPFDLAEGKKAVAESNQRFTEKILKGDTTGYEDFYTRDAVVMYSGGVNLAGRDSINAAIISMIKAGITRIEINTEVVFGTADILVEQGGAIAYVKDKAVDTSKNLILWKKEDGKWKQFRDMAGSGKK